MMFSMNPGHQNTYPPVRVRAAMRLLQLALSEVWPPAATRIRREVGKWQKAHLCFYPSLTAMSQGARASLEIWP